jgi:glycerol-3-phosphate acyltransferase PlsY
LGFNLVGLVNSWIFLHFWGIFYPIFFWLFVGGKGVATFIGVLLTIHPLTGISFVAIWLFVAKVLKISSLSALIATLLTPIIFYFLTHNITASVLILAICVLIFITHKSNIIRLINKQEGEINAG